MKTITEKVLRYKSNGNDLTMGSTKIIPITEFGIDLKNCYLLHLYHDVYGIAIKINKTFVAIGGTVYEFQIVQSPEKAKIALEEIIHFYNNEFIDSINKQIENDQYIKLIEIELLNQLGESELAKKASEYMIGWKKRQEEKEQQEVIKREQEEQEEKERQEKEKQEELNQKYKEYYWIMKYIENMKPIQHGKQYKLLAEDNKNYIDNDGKRQKFYNLVENNIDQIKVEYSKWEDWKKVRKNGSVEYEPIQKSEYQLFTSEEKTYFKINKTQFDYIQWRLKQAEKEKQEEK